MLDNPPARIFFRPTFFSICGTDALLSYNRGLLRPLIKFEILWNRNIITSTRVERMTQMKEWLEWRMSSPTQGQRENPFCQNRGSWFAGKSWLEWGRFERRISNPTRRRKDGSYSTSKIDGRYDGLLDAFVLSSKVWSSGGPINTGEKAEPRQRWVMDAVSDLDFVLDFLDILSSWSLLGSWPRSRFRPSTPRTLTECKFSDYSGLHVYFDRLSTTCSSLPVRLLVSYKFPGNTAADPGLQGTMHYYVSVNSAVDTP